MTVSVPATPRWSVRAGPIRQDELAHYAKEAWDVEYRLSNSAGRNSRVSTTAAIGTSAGTRRRPAKTSSTSGSRDRGEVLPWIVETSAGGDRAAFTFLIDAYREERGPRRETRGARVQPGAPPYKVAVLAAAQKARGDRGQVPRPARRPAQDIMAVYDDTAAIGSSTAVRTRSARRGACDRRRLARGRQGHDPRPRLDGADPRGPVPG